MMGILTHHNLSNPVVTSEVRIYVRPSKRAQKIAAAA